MFADLARFITIYDGNNRHSTFDAGRGYSLPEASSPKTSTSAANSEGADSGIKAALEDQSSKVGILGVGAIDVRDGERIIRGNRYNQSLPIHDLAA